MRSIMDDLSLNPWLEKQIPDPKTQWRNIFWGAMLGVLVWLLCGFGLHLFFNRLVALGQKEQMRWLTMQNQVTHLEKLENQCRRYTEQWVQYQRLLKKSRRFYQLLETLK